MNAGVLAVLDAVIDGECMDQDAMLIKVRAAVAELIEADREYDEAWQSMSGRTHSAARRERAGLRRAAALARVEGAA